CRASEMMLAPTPCYLLIINVCLKFVQLQIERPACAQPARSRRARKIREPRQPRGRILPRGRGLRYRLRHQADSKYRILRFVQKLHPPLGIFFEATRNAAEKVAADRSHPAPGR